MSVDNLVVPPPETAVDEKAAVFSELVKAEEGNNQENEDRNGGDYHDDILG